MIAPRLANAAAALGTSSPKQRGGRGRCRCARGCARERPNTAPSPHSHQPKASGTATKKGLISQALLLRLLTNKRSLG
jgi:hypothetical protein